MIAVAVNAWRVNEQGESLEELEGSEREGRGTVRCGMGKTIDDALATRCTAPASLESFEGEGGTGHPPLVGTRRRSRSSPARSRPGMWTEASMLNPPEACHVSMSSVTWRSSRSWRWKYRSTRWRIVCCSSSQWEAVRWVASWNWTEPSASSLNTPSMTQTWKWKCAFKDAPDHASRGAHEGTR